MLTGSNHKPTHFYSLFIFLNIQYFYILVQNLIHLSFIEHAKGSVNIASTCWNFLYIGVCVTKNKTETLNFKHDFWDRHPPQGNFKLEEVKRDFPVYNVACEILRIWRWFLADAALEACTPGGANVVNQWNPFRACSSSFSLFWLFHIECTVISRGSSKTFIWIRIPVEKMAADFVFPLNMAFSFRFEMYIGNFAPGNF